MEGLKLNDNLKTIDKRSIDELWHIMIFDTSTIILFKNDSITENDIKKYTLVTKIISKFMMPDVQLSLNEYYDIYYYDNDLRVLIIGMIIKLLENPKYFKIEEERNILDSVKNTNEYIY